MSEARTVIEIDVKEKVAKLWRVRDVEVRRWFRSRVEEQRDLVGVYRILNHEVKWTRAVHQPGQLHVWIEGTDPMVVFKKPHPLAGLD